MKKMFVIMILAAFVAATAGTAFSFSLNDDHYSTSLDAKKKSRTNAPGTPGDCIPNPHPKS